MKKLVRVFSVFLAITVAGSPISVFASTSTARRVSIFDIIGQEVTLTRGATSVFPREGQRLSSGNVLVTGEQSNVHIRMDEDSLLLMDEDSQVAIATTGNNLTVSLQSGNALVHINGASQQGYDTITRIGNVGLTVRGTMYALGTNDNGEIYIAMLSGYGEIQDGVYLSAGQMLTSNLQNYEILINEINLQELNQFTMQAIVDNVQYLLQNSTFVTPELIMEVADVLRENYSVNVTLPMIVTELVAGGNNVSSAPGVVLPTPTPPHSNDDGSSNGSSNNNESNGDGNSGNSSNNGDNGGNDSAPSIPSPPPPSQPDPDLPDPEYDSLNLAGDGTPSSPFVLSEISHFTEMVRYANYTNSDFTGMYFKLENSVSLYGVPNNPIVINNFNGTFYGNGNTVTLSNNLPYHASEAMPLFHTLGTSAIVRILTINTNSNTNVGRIGLPSYGVIGALARVNEGTIQNVVVNANVQGGDSLNVGGLVGTNLGIINNSAVTGQVSNGSNVGGLAGTNLGTISNSQITGNISNGANTTGGLVGINYSNAFIDNSRATGVISGNASVGGLFGINNGSVANSHFNGVVNSISGIVGGLGAINSVGATITSSFVGSSTVSGGPTIGGLVGVNYGNISESFSEASVTTNFANSNIGGLVGLNVGSGANVNNSYATGNVVGRLYVGGLVGANLNGATISNVFSTGSVTGYSTNAIVGGIVGVNFNAHINNSVSLNSSFNIISFPVSYFGDIYRIGLNIVGFGVNNFGWTNTEIEWNEVLNNGTTITQEIWDNNLWGSNYLDWNGSVWNISNGTIPTLLNISSPQNPQMPSSSLYVKLQLEDEVEKEEDEYLYPKYDEDEDEDESEEEKSSGNDTEDESGEEKEDEYSKEESPNEEDEVEDMKEEEESNNGNDEEDEEDYQGEDIDTV